MTFTRLGHGYVSDCGHYEIRGGYDNGYFKWRGRHIQTDELVASSQDRQFVKIRCEQHAMSLAHEADNEADLAQHEVDA